MMKGMLMPSSANMSFPPIFRWYRQLFRNPKYRVWVILGTLAYLFSPLDISPDLFPLIGQIDDVALLTLLLSEVSTLLFSGQQYAEEVVEPVEVPVRGVVRDPDTL